MKLLLLIIIYIIHYILIESLLPSIPDMSSIRELTMSPYLRSQIKVESVGILQINISTLLIGFDSYGVIA